MANSSYCRRVKTMLIMPHIAGASNTVTASPKDFIYQKSYPFSILGRVSNMLHIFVTFGTVADGAVHELKQSEFDQHLHSTSTIDSIHS